MIIRDEWMAWFEAFRGRHGFSWYGDEHTAASVDIPLAAVTYFCVLVSIATLIASLGIRGKDRWSTALRAIYGLAIGSIILVSLYSHHWQVGTAEVTTSYVYRSSKHFRGVVGLRVGVHGANVTLSGYFGTSSQKGFVLYSEALPWSDYGHEREHFISYLQRGLPDPILRVTEHLCADGGGQRWGRYFHMAGNFACALLWTAFAFWIVTNILLFSVICYGAYTFLLTGLTMILSCVVYHVCQPANVLQVSFGDEKLQLHYGWGFWLTFVSGISTAVLGTVLVFLDHMFPKKMSEFFAVDIGIDEDISPHPFKESDRRGSIFNNPDRRGSIFHESDRRGSIFQELERRGSIFCDSPQRGNSHKTGWFSNKGFVSDEKGKCNPLYNERNSITEENEEGQTEKEVPDVVIEVGDEEISLPDGDGRRRSSCSSAKEDRDNDLNERQAASSVTINVSMLSRQTSHDSGNESAFLHPHDTESTSGESQDGGTYDDRTKLSKKS